MGRRSYACPYFPLAVASIRVLKSSRHALLLKGGAVRLLLLLTVVALMVTACEGERGPTGPAGADGNANVKTGTISPTNPEWLWNQYYTLQIDPSSWMRYYTRYVDIPVEEITPDIISTGLVLVFFEAHPGSGNWTPLPFQYVSFGAAYAYNLVYDVMEGMIRLHYFYSLNDLSGTIPDLQNAVIPTFTFKYMVIEGTALEAMLAREVDVSDHDRITEYLMSP